MKRIGGYALLGTALGVAAGLVGGARWLAALASAGGPQSPIAACLQNHRLATGVALAVLAAALLRLVGVVTRASVGQMLATGMSIAVGATCYAAVAWMAGTVELVRPGAWPYIVALGVLLVLGGWLARLRVVTVAGLLLVAGFIPWSRSLQSLTGDELARGALSYAAPPSATYFMALTISLVSLGLYAGAVSGALLRREWPRGEVLGASVGLLLALCVSAVQEVVFVTAMRSGQDAVAIVAAMVFSSAVIGALAAPSICGWRLAVSPRVLKPMPAAALMLVCAYCSCALYGYSDYQALARLHPTGLYAYIHFGADGSCQRTLDQSACPTKTQRAQDFLLRYPASAYRPAALLAAAQSQFEEWRFGESAATLAESSRDYPLLEGYRDVLQAFADFANGRTGAMMRPVPMGSHLAEWRQTVGAQTAAYAAERLGLPRRAYGLHSGYVDYLAACNANSWSGESAAYSRARMDSLLGELDRRTIARGSVQISVVGPSGPIRGARVVLVQPHPNAALPSDSTQFTGAWSIPAWNGVWAVTGGNGVATISDVPRGRYDVVLGLDRATWPLGSVAQRGPRGVVVKEGLTKSEPIRLVQSLRLLSPAAESSAVSPVTLRWRGYPGAHHYSATVIAVQPTIADSGASAIVRGTTCWAKARIVGESTTIDAEHFVNGQTRLTEGRYYMWIVHAYGPDDGVLSSSEHYFEFREPTFVLGAPGAHKGGLRQ